jgi:hypothetical protein
MEKNTERYQYETWGPNVRWDVHPPDVGIGGKSIYQLYAFNDDNDIHFETFSETGAWRLINDRGIEISAGKKGSDGNVDICVTAAGGGDICITCQKNGNVKIKAKNVMVEAIEDLDLKAGRNVNITSGSGRILLQGNKIDKECYSGNMAAEKSFVSRAFGPTPIGADITDQYSTFRGLLNSLIG